MPARWVAPLVGAALIPLLLVPVGRWEHHRADAVTLSHMRALRTFAGPELERHLSGYRLSFTFDCLLYSTLSNRAAPDSLTFAVELCFDPNGRLVEAIDRRPAQVLFYSFLLQPNAPVLRVRLPTLIRAFHAAGALLDVRRDAPALPVGFGDSGPRTAPLQIAKTGG